jgi:hypothetical protein
MMGLAAQHVSVLYLLYVLFPREQSLGSYIVEICCSSISIGGMKSVPKRLVISAKDGMRLSKHCVASVFL